MASMGVCERGCEGWCRVPLPAVRGCPGCVCVRKEFGLVGVSIWARGAPMWMELGLAGLVICEAVLLGTGNGTDDFGRFVGGAHVMAADAMVGLAGGASSSRPPHLMIPSEFRPRSSPDHQEFDEISTQICFFFPFW